MRARTRLVLVRHGRPASVSGGRDPDPGLAAAGIAQAEAMAAALDADGGARPVVVSPRRRTRETAAALERRWGRPAVVEPALGEIPTPAAARADRVTWLRAQLAGTWPALAPELQAWRDRLLARLEAFRTDTVVVTHFVAINAAVGAVTGDDRVVCFRPDHCSRTVLELDPGTGPDPSGPATTLRLVSLGTEAPTTIR